MSKKNPNLQPYLDYFRMLQMHVEKGFLEVKPKEHEAYITRAALYAITPVTVVIHEGHAYVTDDTIPKRNPADILQTFHRIHHYAAWLSQQGVEYLERNFALHIVADDDPHDPLYTLLFNGKKRRWFWPFKKVDNIEVIDYGNLSPSATTPPTYNPPTTTV